MKGLKDKTKKKIIILVCALVYLILQFVISNAGRFGVVVFNGVFLAFQLLCCLLIVMTDYNFGGYIALFLIAFGILNTGIIMIARRMISALPGIFNSIVFAIILVILKTLFRMRDREAVTDSLTGLKNRRGLYRSLKFKIENNKPFFLIGINLANYRQITENYGDKCGERILLILTERITAFLGKKGSLSLMDGNRFFVILNGEYDPQSVAEEVIRIISDKIDVKTDEVETELFILPYAGISRFPYDASTADGLLKYTDIALYNAEKNKKDKIKFFNRDMEKLIIRQMELEKLIQKSLEEDYFYLVYQPQFELDGKKLRGFETLIRLRTPDGVNVSPAEFIPVAEKTDLSLKIDDYVMHRAMKEFCEVVKENKTLTISVNVSARNIGSRNFCKKVLTSLEETGFPAENLEIEITEYCLVQSIEITIENIQRLREKGIQVALDDFGTGYTSLSYLAKMPINLLKIDKSLVDDIEENGKSLEFVNAVIHMGHLMNCEVISEGVENETQLSLLGNKGCDFVQGYVWGRPLEYEVAKQLVVDSKK